MSEHCRCTAAGTRMKSSTLTSHTPPASLACFACTAARRATAAAWERSNCTRRCRLPSVSASYHTTLCSRRLLS